MTEEKIKKYLSMAIIACGVAIVIICTIYQNCFSLCVRIVVSERQLLLW